MNSKKNQNGRNLPDLFASNFIFWHKQDMNKETTLL